jgi:hypothetical protein
VSEVMAAEERFGEPASDETASERSPTLARLEDQIAWYDRKSEHCQRMFTVLKVLEIVIAAAIPVTAAAGLTTWGVGAGGAVIVVLEGLQQLQQYQQNWLNYRSTCERLKHEKFLYLATAGHYASASRPDAMLAERIEGLVSQEHAAWVSHREEEPTEGKERQ